MKNIQNLINIIANGDGAFTVTEVDDAVSSLYNLMKDKCLNYILHNFCKNDEFLAQDAFQETMIRLIAQIENGKFSEANKIYSWISTTSRNYVIDQTRYRKNDERNDGYGYQTYTFSKLISNENMNQQINQYTDDRCFGNTLKYHNNKEIMRVIQDAMHNAMLNSKQIKIFMLYHIQNMKQEEIADRLHMNLNTVKTNLKTAKDKMKEYLINKKINYIDYMYKSPTPYHYDMPYEIIDKKNRSKEYEDKTFSF